MKVTVTGATGHLGGFVCRKLVESGFSVRATDRYFRRDFPARVEVANLLNREACYGLVEGADAVVHLGNHSNSGQADAQTIYSENAAMNMNIFQAAHETGVRRIVFASSIQVISGKRNLREPDPAPHNLPYLPLDGDVPANPGNPYALSKQVAEITLAHFARLAQMETIAIRFPLLVDPEWLTWLKSRRVRPHEKPKEAFAFLHMADAASLVLACLRASLPGFRIYFPASSQNGLAKPTSEVIREYYADVPLRRPIEQIESLVDISRIEAETGWKPEHNSLL